MATIKPFLCIRPTKELASRVAALPYDVYNRQEAKEVAKLDELSFLNIDRAETQFDDSVSTYDDKVYQKAKELLDKRIEDGVYIKEETPSYYIYELIMDGRSQTGIVACASIDDYENGIIKKHENTREEKELDRIRHVDTCNAQTGPIFLAYRSNDAINQVVNEKKMESPLYHFISDDGIEHNVWVIDQIDQIAVIKENFQKTNQIYIADGHHRAASAVKVGQKRRAQKKEYTGEEEFNYFLSVLFPDDQLFIMPYNRVVKDLNGYKKEEFLEKISEKFDIEKIGSTPYEPEKKGYFGLYLDHTWYQLIAKEEILSDDPVLGLDVSILQNELLSPILGIGDPRVDTRIDFVGGIRGLKELEKRAKTDMKLAFSMYPTSIQELFDVADAGKLMPPKSTWFEPKLRSGIFIHSLEDEK
ncbi:MAG: DUF1015 domain-containing protein [Lachnospiraceae bacterium]